MHINKTTHVFTRFLRFVSGFLPSLFWILIIFGFDESPIALITILAAVIHELGHIIYLKKHTNTKTEIRSTFNGFRIKQNYLASYKSDALLYAAGPFFNIISALVIFIVPIPLEFRKLFCIISVATALSNLLPIKGYDGYGIIRSLALKSNKNKKIQQMLDKTSFSLVVFLTFLSLYIVTRIGASHWMACLFMLLLIREVSEKLKNTFCEK